MNQYRIIIINSFLFLLAGAFSFSCEDDGVEQRKGSVSFGFSISDRSGRINQDIALSHLIISAENDNGTVFEDEVIPLVSFDNEYTTEPVSLNTGSYRLTKYLVAGEDGTIHYATPVEGSELAYLVNDPLPIHIVVSKNEVIEVKPEVVSTSEGTVEDFGYGEFGFNIVETFDVLLGVFHYDEEESDFVLTDAEIIVYGDSDSLTTKSLFATTNKLTLPDRFEEFTFEISKDGYNPYIYTFSSDSIKSYQGDNANGPLEIILSSASVTEGLIAYYPFNGNANDESDNSNHGTVSGATLTTDRNGNTNSAYSFDGVDDYIDLGNSALFFLGKYDGFTISAWVKSNEILGSLPDGQTIFSKYIAASDNRFYSFYIVDEHDLRFAAWLNGARDTRNDVQYDIGFEWIHVVAVGNTESYKLYLDGMEVASSDKIFEMKTGTTTANAMIGAVHHSTTTYDLNFDGAIDEVRVYNRALSASEIQAIFNQ